MNEIQVTCTTPSALVDAVNSMVFAARLTQRGHKLTSMADITNLFNLPFKEELLKTFVSLPHPTIQKFGIINYVVVGASRRFLAQITRHQNEVKFMSASLQYSDYAGAAQFCVPYELIKADAEHIGNAQYAEKYHRTQYINSCISALHDYERAREQGIDNDTCGYMMPQGMRNVLMISATPYQWRHMIRQRICRRNTPETRYVMLRIWEDLMKQAYGKVLFAPDTILPICCNEGSMRCGNPIGMLTPTEIIQQDFPYIAGGAE